MGSSGGHYFNIGAQTAIDEVGNIYTVGVFWGTIHFGPFTLTTTGDNFTQDDHCFITKQDRNGNYIWAKKIGGIPGYAVSFYPSGTFDMWARTNLFSVKKGNIYLCGTIGNTNNDFNPGPGVNHVANSAGGFVLKLDTAGGFKWVKGIDGTGGTAATALGVDDAENCYVVGIAQKNTVTIGGVSATNSTNIDSQGIFYAKLDPYGNCVWIRITQNDWAQKSYFLSHAGPPDAAVTPSGKLIIASPFLGNFKMKKSPTQTEEFHWHYLAACCNTNYSDQMLAIINTNGWLEWGTEWGGFYVDTLPYNTLMYTSSIAYNENTKKLVIHGSFNCYAAFHNSTGYGIDTIIGAQNIYGGGGVNGQPKGIGNYLVVWDLSTPTPTRDWTKVFQSYFSVTPPKPNQGGTGPTWAKDVAFDDFGNIYVTAKQTYKTDYSPHLSTYTFPPDGTRCAISKYDINGNFIWLTGVSPSASSNPYFRITSLAISPCNNKLYASGFFGVGSTGSVIDVDPSLAVTNVSSDANTSFFQVDMFTWAINQDNVPNPITITSGYNNPLCVGQTLQLNASASGAVSYSWTGPNGFSSTQQNPSVGGISALDAGDYIVTVRNAQGCSNKDTVTVSIGLTPPDAGVLSSSSPTLCSGATMSVTTTGNPGGTWEVVNAGGTATINSSGVVTGGSPGSVIVRYIDTKSCGSDTATLSLQINQQPNAGTLSGPISVCLNGTTSFSTNGDPGGSWSIINNTGSAVVNNAGVVTGISAGFVTVQYVVSNLCGTDTTSKNLMIIDLPNAGTITGPSSVCKGDSVQLSTNGSGGGTWSSSNPFGAYPQPSGEVLGNIPGNYTISYTVNNSCGSDVATYQITVNNSADAGIISGADTVCIGSIFTYTSTGNAGGAWFSNNGNININSTGEVTGLTAGTSVISYIVNNTCGQDTATKVVTVVNLPNAGQISGPSASVCINNSLQLTTNGDAGGVWTTSNSNCSVDSTGMVTGLFQGTCIVEYIVSSACGSDTAQYAITINTKGQKVINNYTECEGFSVTVNGNTYDSTGTYTDYVGCDTIITQLQIVPNPELILSKQDAVCDQNNGQAIANGSSQYPPISYLWNNNSTDSILSNLDPGIYTVIITDSMGCTNTGTVTIDNLTKDCGYVVSIPGAFTPNGDGNNDLLMVSGKGIKSLDFKVFNRWGNLVFETTSPNEGWDGVYRGKKQNTAVFMYTLKVTFKNGKTVTKTGDVGLIR